MNKENLKRGQQLSEDIEKLEEQLKTLELATSIYEGQIGFYKETSFLGKVNSYWIDFDVLKCLAINKITKRLEEIKKEFKAL